MKKSILIFVAIASTLSFLSCSKSEKSKLEGKWQLRQYEYPNGTTSKCDSVFYNFQYRSFSAICLTAQGGYPTFFGNYSLIDNKISINLLPEYSGSDYERFLGWEDFQRTFQVIQLSAKELKLNYNDTISVFRKY